MLRAWFVGIGKQQKEAAIMRQTTNDGRQMTFQMIIGEWLNN